MALAHPVNPRKLVRQAVRQPRTTFNRSLQERLFVRWFSRLVYTQIWEDPRVDARALQIGPDSHILTISSAGCNVLNYLTHGPASVVAVDINPAHLALTRLRIAAVRHLPDHPALYNFFGRGAHEANSSLYRHLLHPRLDAATRAYWSMRPAPGWPRRPRYTYFTKGFYTYGIMARFQRMVDRLGRFTVGRSMKELLQAQTLADQVAFYENAIEPFFAHWLTQALGQLPAAVYSLGIPPQQFDYMRAQGALHAYFRNRIRRLACGFPLSDNYFAWQAFGQCYHPEVLPPYLQEDTYDKICYYLPHVKTKPVSVQQALRTAPKGRFTGLVLLDAQDWMSDDQIVNLWHDIATALRPGGRIIFRTAGPDSPLDRVLPSLLRKRFEYKADTSAALHAQDRSAVYGGFHLYVYTG